MHPCPSLLSEDSSFRLGRYKDNHLFRINKENRFFFAIHEIICKIRKTGWLSHVYNIELKPAWLWLTRVLFVD